MKKILIALLLSAQGFAIQSAKIIAASENIPVTFNTGAGSLIVSEAIGSHRHLQVLNTTTEVIAVTVTGPTQPAPTSLLEHNNRQIYVPASGAIVSDDFLISPKSKIYIRTDNASASSGIVRVSIW